MLPIDLTTVLKDAPVGDWIALSHGQDRIVATAKTLDEAIKAAKEQGEENPVVLKIPPVGARLCSEGEVMQSKKSWTVMVYLAADNNLFTFGVDSLRQMKVAAGQDVNILAEFDTGPMNQAKRYFFDGREPIGSIEDNVVDTFGPTDTTDPQNLTNFVEWGAKNYPADHYLVTIWGHGGGIDNGFPRQPDNSFVLRHPLLSVFKGTPDDNPKGTPDDDPEGTPDDECAE